MTISLKQALQLSNQNKGIIIDVREPVEYREFHLPYSHNLPATSFHLHLYQAIKDKKLLFICQTGSRAQQVYDRLKKAGFNDLAIIEEHFNSIDTTTLKRIDGWSIDRQFRLTLGTLLLMFLVGEFFISKYFLVIPMILCAGLIFTSITDNCYMRIGISLLPWNKLKKE